MRGWITAFVLASSACAGTTGLVETPYTKTTVEDFTPVQRRIFASTLRAIASLEPKALTVDDATYNKSRFRRVFGFELDGKRLAEWWARRIRTVRRGRAWTVAVYDGEHGMTVTDEFFERTLLERMFVLVHEARHADGDGYDHVECPRSSSPACDDRPDGAYSFQAAFLFELYAYGLIDAEAAHDAYRITRTRILVSGSSI